MRAHETLFQTYQRWFSRKCCSNCHIHIKQYLISRANSPSKACLLQNPQEGPNPPFSPLSFRKSAVISDEGLGERDDKWPGEGEEEEEEEEEEERRTALDAKWRESKRRRGEMGEESERLKVERLIIQMNCYIGLWEDSCCCCCCKTETRMTNEHSKWLNEVMKHKISIEFSFLNERVREKKLGSPLPSGTKAYLREERKQQ